MKSRIRHTKRGGVITIACPDCPAGVAGDRCFGALVSAGAPLDYLNQILSQLGIDQEIKLWSEFSGGIKQVTPTGAAIAVALSQAFGDPPAMTLEKVGLEAGSQDLAIPNLVRLWLGKQDVAAQHG